MFSATKIIQQNGTFKGIPYAYLGWHCFKQRWITTEYVLPSLTAKQSLQLGNHSFWVELLSHTHGFMTRMEYECQNKNEDLRGFVRSQ